MASIPGTVQAPPGVDGVTISRAVSKPCLFCRQRKVKCDRAQPCRGCIRFRKTCTYEDAPDTSYATTSPNNHVELQARLARVEALLEQQRSKDSASPTPQDHERCGISDAISKALKFNGRNKGALLTKGDSTVFVDHGFWVNLLQKSDILDLLLSEGEDPQGDVLIGGTPGVQQSPAAWSPKQDQVAVLIDLFFERVEPFIHVLDEPAFRTDCQSFWARNLPHRQHFEALLGCIVALTARVIPNDIITTIFGSSKAAVLPSLSKSANTALFNAGISTSMSLTVLQALLYWITFLYQNADIKSANVILGLVNQIACRQGLHRDPSKLGVSEVTAELRARALNHLCYLNTKPYMFEGITGTPFLDGGFYPRFCNDAGWTQGLHAQPGTLPTASNSCLKFAMLRRQFSTLTCHIMAQAPQIDVLSGEDIVRAADDQLQKDYFPVFDENRFPLLWRFEALCTRMWYQSLAFSVDVANLSSGRHQDREFNNRLFDKALSLLSVVERAESAADSFGWSWVFRCDPEFVAISILLSNLTKRVEHLDQQQINEAWKQVENFRQRHDNEEFSLRDTFIWRVIEHFRKQAFDRAH